MDTICDKNQPYSFDYFFEESTKNRMDHTSKRKDGRCGLEELPDLSSESSSEDEDIDEEDDTTQ